MRWFMCGWVDDGLVINLMGWGGVSVLPGVVVWSLRALGISCIPHYYTSAASILLDFSESVLILFHRVSLDQ